MRECGLVAILRGICTDEVQAVRIALYESGFKVIEVPLNSPQAFESNRRLRLLLAADCVIGAGTVLTSDEVSKVKEAGGSLIVMPHSDPEVIRAAKRAAMDCAPGVATVT